MLSVSVKNLGDVSLLTRLQRSAVKVKSQCESWGIFYDFTSVEIGRNERLTPGEDKGMKERREEGKGNKLTAAKK